MLLSWEKPFIIQPAIIICHRKVVLYCQVPKSSDIYLVNQGILFQVVSASDLLTEYMGPYSVTSLGRILSFGLETVLAIWRTCLSCLTSDSDRLSGRSLDLLASCMHWVDTLADRTDSWMLVWTSTSLLLAESSVTVIPYPLSYRYGSLSLFLQQACLWKCLALSGSLLDNIQERKACVLFLNYSVFLQRKRGGLSEDLS